MKPSDFKIHVIQTVDSLLRLNEDDLPVLKSNDPARVKQSITENLPIDALSFDSLIDDFEQKIAPFLNHNKSPKYAAYITGSGNPVGAIAELIKGYLNQNGLKWNNSPIAAELEQLVVKWVSDFCLLANHKKGVLTSGGSMSNLMALHFAMASKFPEREHHGLYGQKPFTVYCSEETHSSIERAMVFLGLGRSYLRKIPVNEQFQIRVDLLVRAVKEDIRSGLQPLAIVGNAGTTNTGSIDDLEALGLLAKKYQVWYHVDGAYGLPAIRISELKEKFKGVELADSIIVNPHKWMYVPFEASCVLVREIPKAIHFAPNYLMTENAEARWESSEHTIELSKEFRALKVWFTLKYYGAKKLTELIQQDIHHTALFARLLGENGFEIVPYHDLSILCFRAKGDDESIAEKLNVELLSKVEKDGSIFLTGTKLYGKTYLRTYFGNPERTAAYVEYMVDQLVKLLHSVATNEG